MIEACLNSYLTTSFIAFISLQLEKQIYLNSQKYLDFFLSLSDKLVF
ncbi:hypothetical protein LV85_02121 [Algoriphagus chordae]|uniref:Uncharacterized protein n=1 Tax=Algoriphagus chordae TaxID=237019 RepID=A0A2W7SMM0_9BACT|nr:hypothetical protein LV85_02121 [Algoriphagus chordae]